MTRHLGCCSRLQRPGTFRRSGTAASTKQSQAITKQKKHGGGVCAPVNFSAATAMPLQLLDFYPTAKLK
jgi:hypothetical protein